MATLRRKILSFHLMPVYAFPGLLKGISPELKRRMQGKSCFNFTAIDEKLLGELSELTDAGFQSSGPKNSFKKSVKVYPLRLEPRQKRIGRRKVWKEM